MLITKILKLLSRFRTWENLPVVLNETSAKRKSNNSYQTRSRKLCLSWRRLKRVSGPLFHELGNKKAGGTEWVFFKEFWNEKSS